MDHKHIPFRGIDLRMPEDESPDGVSETLLNLQPQGLTEDPYWVPHHYSPKIENDSGQPYSYNRAGDVVAAYWQNRDTIGSYAEDPDASLKRLIVMLNDGSIQIVDPNAGAGWEATKTYVVDTEAGVEWDAKFTTVGNVVSISIIKDGKPFDLLHLHDDLFIPGGYPELPYFKIWPFLIDELTNEEFENGDYVGFPPGRFAFRFAYISPNGKPVKMSRPYYIDMTSESLSKYHRWGFEVAMQDNSIGNTEFWTDYFSGIAVYLSFVPDIKGSYDEELTDLFYEVDFFGAITKDDLEKDKEEFEALPLYDRIDPNSLLVNTKDEELPQLPVAPIDDNTHHKITASEIFSYNKQLILGDTGVHFSKPKLDESVLNEHLSFQNNFSPPGFGLSQIYIFSANGVNIQPEHVEITGTFGVEVNFIAKNIGREGDSLFVLGIPSLIQIEYEATDSDYSISVAVDPPIGKKESRVFSNT